ncbi:hypothetical protein [Methanomassiliicoccus luminyensis]|uniref:hypothetical protein n=1 Tax=Methanomassiliicoccus luminyensis TaxID=1080712 RepID=UPI00036615C0|nr:hypothetical protein [Methanomassiliicoccus luminyensis]
MVKMDVEDLTSQRMEMIQMENPDLFTRYDLEEGDEGEWALITVTDEHDRPVVFEIIESEDSWRRPDLVEKYNELAAEASQVLVILPDDIYEEAVALLEKEASRSIDLRSYGDIGLILRA